MIVAKAIYLICAVVAVAWAAALALVVVDALLGGASGWPYEDFNLVTDSGTASAWFWQWIGIGVIVSLVGSGARVLIEAYD